MGGACYCKGGGGGETEGGEEGQRIGWDAQLSRRRNGKRGTRHRARGIRPYRGQGMGAGPTVTVGQGGCWQAACQGQQAPAIILCCCHT